MIKIKIFIRILFKFGIFFSINLLFQSIFSKRFIKLKLKNFEHPLFLRKDTTDIKVFYQVFLNEEYKMSTTNTPFNIIDAGANIGLASVYFANKFKKSTIYSIEPEESNFELLKKNTEKYTNITPIQAGIWSHKTQLSIKDSADGEWAFEVYETPNNENAIKAIAFDNIMDKYNFEIIDILKVDIEGSEKEVFSKNYEKWLPKTKILIVETHDRMKKGTSKAVFNAITDYDFGCEILGENFLFNNLNTND